MGVIVLGMHRSGTSAVTRVVHRLGLDIAVTPMPPQPDNPIGFSESQPLCDFNDELLAELGGSWDAPPLLDPDGLASEVFDAQRSRASTLFAAEHPTRHWVWKDPRACVLLPFWRSVLGNDVVAIVVIRDPVAVAHSLLRRNELALEVGVAAWERYLRAILRGAPGMPALALRYDDLIDEPDSSVDAIARFLAAHQLVDTSVDRSGPGEGPTADLRSLARESIRRDLRHETPTGLAVALTDEQRALAVRAGELCGTHAALAHSELPRESPSTALLLGARARERDRAAGAQIDGNDPLSALGETLTRLGECQLAQLELSEQLVEANAALGQHEPGRLAPGQLDFAGRVRRFRQRIRGT